MTLSYLPGMVLQWKREGLALLLERDTDAVMQQQKREGLALQLEKTTMRH